jgi:hypothetical protein
MASLHVIVDRALSIKTLTGTFTTPVLSTRELQKTKPVPAEAPSELRRVLERAADDPGFIARLTEQGSKALAGFNLTFEEKAALLSGDIRWIEARLGKLDRQLSTWLWCRLQQEIW